MPPESELRKALAERAQRLGVCSVFIGAPPLASRPILNQSNAGESLRETRSRATTLACAGRLPNDATAE